MCLSKNTDYPNNEIKLFKSFFIYSGGINPENREKSVRREFAATNSSSRERSADGGPLGEPTGRGAEEPQQTDHCKRTTQKCTKLNYFYMHEFRETCVQNTKYKFNVYISYTDII